MKKGISREWGPPAANVAGGFLYLHFAMLAETKNNDKIPRLLVKYGIFQSAIDVLKTLVIALGAGLGVWGAVNLLEAYGYDSPVPAARA